jgi:putative FmdB family regulatory protein
MPVYEYICKDCGTPMEVRASVAEYSAGLRLHCAECGSENLARILSSIGIGSGRAERRPICGPGGGSGCCN